MKYKSTNIIVLFILSIILQSNLVFGDAYTCFVYSNLIPLSPQSNNCSFAENTTQTCSSVVNCLNGFGQLNLTNTDQLGVYLMNEKYDDEGCCNLVIDFPAQLFISKMESLEFGSLIDCQQEQSFISSLRSNLILFGIGVENVVNTAIIVPQSSGVPTILAIQESYFQNCQGQKGGAIQMDYPNSLTISNSTFTNNSANYGGAIYAQNAIITESTFTNNRAVVGGGAIYSNSLTVESCTFTGNSADQGGAINSVDIHAQGTVFRNNYATSYGGAAYVTLIYSVYSNFFGNQAQYGGALLLYASNQQNVINYGQITRNSAVFDGGAIYISMGLDPGNLDLSHSKIYYNNANSSGGALYFNQTLISFVSGGMIYNNTLHDDSSKNEDSSTMPTSSDYSNEIPNNQEIGCNNNNTLTCNLCANSNCTQCKAMNGNCIYQNGQNYCLLPKICLYGTCLIDKAGEYACNCHPGYPESNGCTQSNDSSNHTNSNSDSRGSQDNDHSKESNSSDPSQDKKYKRLEIILPIVFGVLIILFIITLYFMIRRKKSEHHTYQIIN